MVNERLRAGAQGPAPSAVDISLVYKSTDDFIRLNAGKLSFAKAIYQKKLVLKGNMRMLKRVQKLVSAAATKAKRAPTVAASVRRAPTVTRHSDGTAVLRVLPQREWMNDAECSTCQKCSNPFTFFRRRHHCRYCGVFRQSPAQSRSAY